MVHNIIFIIQFEYRRVHGHSHCLINEKNRQIQHYTKILLE